jgi:putative membrane protein
MMGWYHDGLGWGGWLAMTLSMVAFWALVVFAVVAIFRSGRDERPGPAPGSGPMDILDQRFARGDIDESEYRARVDVLRSSVR